MNKLLVITVLIALFSFGAQGFRVPRQAEDEVVAEEAVAEVHEEAVAEAPEEAVAEAPEEVAPEEPAPEEPVAEAAPEEHVSEAEPEPAAPDAEHEASGPFTMAFDTVRSAWDKSVDTATGWLETVKGLKLEEKAKTLYEDTANAVNTYAGILQDQMYHLIYAQ